MRGKAQRESADAQPHRILPEVDFIIIIIIIITKFV